MNYNLDFNHKKSNWFDLWHIHFDNEGKGDISFENRKLYLNMMFIEFEKIKTQLRNYPSQFQVWIFICENDSRYDAIYIHTENPNGTPFPIKINTLDILANDTELYNHIANCSYDVISISKEDESHIYIYDKNFGIPLV